MLFFNHIIIFMQEGYLDFLLSGSVSLVFIFNGELSWDSLSLVVSNLLSFAMIISCVTLFALINFHLWPNFDLLKAKKFKDKFWPAYEMLNLRHGKMTMLWPSFFTIRRSLFVIGVCAMSEFGSLQILFFLCPTIVAMAILATIQPLQDLPSNRLELFNSIMILLMSYSFMCFTSFVPDPEAR